MAINFEAANMAGYNNPKIEVFNAIINYETNAITDAPRKTEIIRCLNRGSIPAIMCVTPDGSEGSLLWVYTWGHKDAGDTIMFGSIALTIAYTTDSEQPIVATG